MAIANELAARFWLDRGYENIARVFMTDAYDCYSSWGVLAKVEDLEKQYPQLISSKYRENLSMKYQQL